MPGKQVSSGEMKRLLSDTQRREIDAHLAEGRSVALYEDDRGRPSLVISYGTRDADLPGLAPSGYGGGTLSMFVPAPTKTRPPGMSYSPPPQIARPHTMPGYTEHPSVEVEMRSASHPRAHSASLITPLLPGREPVEPPPPPAEPLTPEQEWWTAQLSGR